ncbi:hypothetical protein RFI_00978 [Reticulomyxa filosa]|uniref:3'-5' exonuclease domain-containing protein n=1 Tax=Reticulomyxa filosa TaxID=46433 RepID=X6PDF0_RETFI|nr:hypothetical protein RFI_00978 [Reticulomyxa filosa]|eukprot:ETO36084.1 hypothetical protein RFI_00978 [Reticulomyxa filosa]
MSRHKQAPPTEPVEPSDQEPQQQNSSEAAVENEDLHTSLQQQEQPKKAKKKKGKKEIRIHIVSTVEACEEAIKTLSTLRYVGFDCEGYSSLSRKGKIALMQFASSRDSYVIDIQAMNDEIPKCVKDFLEQKPHPKKGPIKIIHDCRADQDALFHVYGIRLNGVFDTSVASVVKRTELGRQPTRLSSLSGLMERVLPYNLMENLSISYPTAISSPDGHVDPNVVDTKCDDMTRHVDAKQDQSTPPLSSPEKLIVTTTSFQSCLQYDPSKRTKATSFLFVCLFVYLIIIIIINIIGFFN